MVAFSIMIWFVGIILTIVAISLLKGNASSMHGKVYETTKDKEGYAKESGKIVMFMAAGMFISGATAFTRIENQGLLYAMIVICIVIIVSACLFYKVQKKYGTDATEK